MLPRFEDLVLIYAVLTPTSVLYWHTTAVLLDQLVGHNAVKMVLGFASAVAFAYYHEVFSNNAPTSSSRLVLTSYETAFDYMVKLSCLCYHLGCRTIYDLLLATGLLAPVHIAVLAAAFLIHLRGFRNVLALPLVVNNDDSVERYRPLSSLTFSSDILTDDITRIAAIWSSIAVFWEAVGESVAIGTGLNQYLMMFYGYIAVALVMTVGKDVAEKAVAQSANETYKLAVENAYVGTSAVAGIMLWHGLDSSIGSAASLINSVTEELAPSMTITVFASQLVAYAVMKWFGVTRSLFVRVCNRDGEGLNFNTVVQMTSV